MPKTFFITTAIDYTNSPPHIGHAYEKVLADVIARYHRLKGDSVFFLTGVDQHGQKVQQSAAKAGVPPAEFVKEITQKFVDLWKILDVKYDEWAETTSERHKKVVQGILQRLFDAGQIYKDKQAGYYSVRQEQFLTDKERGPDGEFGSEWGQVEFREEENYYFRLSQHKDWLLSYLDNRKDAVIPNFRQTELRNAVEKLSGDLCISRPKSRLDWGIELPFDKDFVNYVWFDALTNYISFAGYDPKADNYEKQPQEFRDRWSKDTLQIIGKDILVPAHGIYWLIMLHAIGFPNDAMPQLLVHGWWNLGGAKMSKSAGNVIDPFVLADKYGAEALRFYLVSDIATGKDADFSEERVIERYNADLANSLGNLLNRTLSMVSKYVSGRLRTTAISLNDESKQIPAGEPISLPTRSGEPMSLPNAKELGLRELIENSPRIYVRAMESSLISLALVIPGEISEHCNRLVQNTAPWQLAEDPMQNELLSAVMYHLAEALRIIAVLISPVLPKAAHGIFDQLNWKMDLSGNDKRFSLADAEWGKLPDGHVVGKAVPLFPRIES
ncbi:MAG: methionine--tRNA ligase [Verrucomicrobia bacterium]|nr:MAG: methionine--tRNA ligase [Verrucomicrobiota bacterium]